MAGPQLTAAGLQIQTVEEIAAETLSQLRTNASQPALLASPGSPVGVFVQTIADRERALQEAAQAGYTSFSLDAQGSALDRIAQAFGLSRLDATATTATVAIVNTSGAPITIATGSQVRDATTGEQYDVTAAVTVPAGGADFLGLAANTVGEVPISSPSWQWITSGYSAVVFGATTASAQGTAAETDAQLRGRWLVSYAVAGSGTLDSLVTAIRALTGTADARVYENTTTSLGISTPEIISNLPAKSFVSVLRTTATAAEIGQAILDHKPAGIEPFGSSTVSVTDVQGVAQSIGYELATSLSVGVVLTVTGSSAAFDAAMTAAVEGVINALTIGDDVIAQRVECAALDVSGSGTTLVAANLNSAGNGVDLAIAWNRYAVPGVIIFVHI